MYSAKSFRWSSSSEMIVNIPLPRPGTGWGFSEEVDRRVATGWPLSVRLEWRHLLFWLNEPLPVLVNPEPTATAGRAVAACSGYCAANLVRGYSHTPLILTPLEVLHE